MSEQARIASLQEQIKEANKNIWVSLIPLKLGIWFIVYGILDLTLWHHASIGMFNFILITIGMACMIIGICMAIPYNRQHKKLRKELESIPASFPTCSKCGKDIPQGNFEFCPFCGNSLKK